MQTFCPNASERQTKIYGLRRPGGPVRYIGKTIADPKERLRCHRNSKSSDLPVHRWMRKHGDVKVTVLEVLPLDADWSERERAWIAACVATGFCLNIKKGGEGAHVVEFTQRHRDSLRRVGIAKRTGGFYACDVCLRPKWRTPCQVAKNHGRFCSRKCADIAQRGRPGTYSPDARVIEAAAAARRARTHCLRDHPLSGENVRVNKAGSRICKTCQREATAAHRAKNPRPRKWSWDR